MPTSFGPIRRAACAPRLSRRDVGRGALALAAVTAVGAPPTPAAAAGIPPSGLIPFQVRRSEGELGHHRVRFDRSGSRLTVDIDIMLEVRIAFVTVFRYSHQGREVWEDGRLVSMETRTDDDGEAWSVSARATEEGLRVTGSGGDYLAPADTIPGSYWNIALLDRSQVLNAQKGDLEEIDARFLGAENVSAGPRQISARRHRILGESLEIDVWYNDAQQWVKLGADIRGSRLDYELEPGGRGSPNLLTGG
jgi:hypothetical protein